MASPNIRNKRSSVSGKVPTTTDLAFGEFGINTNDGKVFISASNAVVGVGTTVITVNPWSVGVGTTAYNTYFNAGNVGVGTTSPTSTLHIVGNELITGISTIGSISINSGVITATTGVVTYYGDGSKLTGIVSLGTGVAVQNSGSALGTATTINFSTNLTATFGGGIVTVTAASGSGVNYWTQNSTGIHTLSNIGIGTTNAVSAISIGSTGVINFSDTNIRIGNQTTGSGISTGTNNNFIGVGAGQSTTIGFNNNFFGYQAGIANTSGDNNSFFGYQSGFSNTSGSCNIFFGFQSGFCNIAASQNQFFGFQAGYYNTTGGGNLFIGRRAGYRNTSATFNTFIGRYAGCSNTIGTNNNFMGQSAGLLNTTGNRNNFFGALAGCGNTSGSYNNFFGCGSGTLNTSGNENIFLGRFSGCTNATGSCNIVIGSGRTSTPVLNGDNQLVIGVGSTDWIIGNSSFNVGIGTTNPRTKLQVGGIIGFNDTNVRIGDSTTGSVIGIGTYNNFIGVGAGQSNTSGSYNNFFGYQAGFSNVSGNNNNFFGPQSGFSNVSTNNNNFFGACAGRSNVSGTSNNFFGPSAGKYNTTGCHNTFIGNRAGESNTTGRHNNFFGFNVGLSNIDGWYNNFLGHCTGGSNTSGCYNNFFGRYAGRCNITGCFNNLFGSFVGISTNNSYKVVIGGGVGITSLFDSPDTTKNIQLAIGVRTDSNPANYWIVGNENFNVGIGTTNPTSKLQVQGDTLVSGIVTAAQLDLTANASVNDSVLYLSGSPSGTASQSGLLGIGTLSFTDTNIIANFSHNVNSYAQLVVQNRNSGSTASADIIVNNDRTAGTTYYGDFGINATTYTGTSPFNDPDGTYLYAAGGTLAVGTLDALDFRVATGSTAATPVTRMTITGVGGSVGIGTTTPTQILQVQGNARITGAIFDSTNTSGTSGQVLQSTVTGIQWATASAAGGLSISTVTSSATNYVTFVSSASTTSIGITQTNLTFVPSTGNLSAVQFTSLSDRTQKKNITKIDNALEIVNQLEGVRFEWIDNNKSSMGLIAQDTEQVLPEVVETNEDGIKSVSYGNIIGVLIEAIKEQQIRIEELERKLNA